MYIKIAIFRNDNRRDPEMGDYKFFLDLTIEDEALNKMNAAQVAEEFFVATNAPIELMTETQLRIRDEYLNKFSKYDGDDSIKWFSTSVGDKLYIKHARCAVFDYTQTSLLCESIGWSEQWTHTTESCSIELAS